MLKTCTVRLLDEVNVQLVGIDEVTLKKAAEAVTYTVKGSQYMPAVRAKRWNGKKSLVDRRDGSTYRHMLYKVLPPVATAGYDIEIVDKRFDYNIFVPEISDNLFEGQCYERFEGIMEPHQYEAINAITTNGGGLLLLATGAGKTVITAGFAKLYEQFGKVLVVVPRKDLAIETAACIEALGMPDTGCYYDEEKNPSWITVTTWQSLELMPELFQDVNCVIIDECHGADANVLFRLLTKDGRNVPIRIGMTGTLPKDDLSRYNIISALGPIVYTKKAKELQDIGFLARCKIFILKYLDKHRPEYQSAVKGHELYIDEARWQFRHPERLSHISRFISAVSESSGNTLVLVRNIEYGEALHAAIPGSIYLSGRDKGRYRHQVYKQFNQANNGTLICTYGIASTGINVARLFNMVLIEPGRESVPLIQSIGRGLRKAYDKQFCTVYHIGSNAKFSSKHLGDVQDIYDENQYPYEVIEVDY